jgi:hypothetical protein
MLVLVNKALGNSFDCGIHCIKGLAVFLSTAGMSLVKLSLKGNNLLFPARESLVSGVPAGDGKTAELLLFPASHSLISDIPAGDGKTANLFLQCTLLDSN